VRATVAASRARGRPVTDELPRTPRADRAAAMRRPWPIFQF
jgi:hypothetical protein